MFALGENNFSAVDIISTEGFFARTFPIIPITEVNSVPVETNVIIASDEFKFDFSNAGLMSNGIINTAAVSEIEEPPITLGQILESNVDEKFYITDERMEKWQYLKGAKKIPRVAANGHEYIYSEGPVAFPDAWDKPGRTMLTSESTLNRSTHVVEDPGTHRLRLITPIEAERLQGFDDNWTNSGMTQRMRYFCMGNALVVPMITRMGRTLDQIIANEP